MTKLKGLGLYALAIIAVLFGNPVHAALPPFDGRTVSDADRAYLASIGGLYRNTGVDAGGERYSGIAAVVPRSEDVRLIWWIDEETLSGVGERDRDVLVVRWGEKYPVVYSSRAEGVLSGEWDDGAATDTLELFAPLEPEPAPAPDGRYRLTGQKPDGTAYSGTVSISRKGDDYLLVWQAGTERYRGAGKRHDNLLQVRRGDGIPVIYALNADGTLRGLWGKGAGEETLTPIH